MSETFTQRISRILLLILLFMLAGFGGFAQYTPTPLDQGRQYTALAKDQSGNLFAIRSNTSGSAYELVKFTNAAGTPQILYSGLQHENQVPPIGLAVNSAGDVFATSLNASVGWEIIKFPAPGNNTPVTIQSGKYYAALAIDASDNLLSLEWDGADNYQVWRYPAGNEQSAGTVVFNGLPVPTTGSTTYPAGLVTDSHGNIFLTDFHENGNGGRLIKLTAPTFTSTVLATGRGFTSLAVDGDDNLYITEAAFIAGKAHVMKYTDPTQAGEEISTGTQLSYSPNYHPWGLVVMPDGTIFANGGTENVIQKLSPPPVNVTSVTAITSSPTNATTITFRVTFSAPVANVTTGAFSLTVSGPFINATITSVTPVSSSVYDVVVTPGSGTEGTIRLIVTGTGISPTIANAPYTTGATITMDRITPSGSVSINSGAAYTNTSNVTLSITGNDVNGPLQMAFSVDGGAYSAYEAFTATKAITLPAIEGTRTVEMRLKDAAGNVASFSDDIILDVTAPNTTITSGPTSSTNSTSATFTFASNEANSTFQGRLDGGPYMPITTPTTLTGLADGGHTFEVRAIDQAGNSDATPATYSWTIDGTGPQIISVAVPADDYYHAGQHLDFVVKYDEPAIVTQDAGTPYINIIIGLDAKQVPYLSGTGTNELTFRYTVQAGEMDMDGIVVQPLVQNNSGFIRDALGNNASTSLQNVDPTSQVRVNTSIPSVTLSFGDGVTMPTNAPFIVKAIFSEAVSGLTVSDFSVLNTTVSGLTTSDYITYQVLMTPATQGTRTINLPANVVENIGHNPNTASNTLTYTYDITAPVVTSVTVPESKYYKAGETLTFTVHYNENIVVDPTGGTPVLSLQIGAATVNATYVSAASQSITFSYTVVDGDMDSDGIVVNSLELNSATIKDAAGNNANLTLNNIGNTSGVRVNTSHPSTTITSAAPAIVSGPFNVTITFSETVYNFVQSDITVTNGTVTAFIAINGSTYTAQITPTAEGTVTIKVADGMAENIGENGNVASNTLSRIYDVVAPSVTSVNVPADGYYKAGQDLEFVVMFSEEIALNTAAGTPYLNITIGTSTVQATYSNTSGTDGLRFVYTVADGDMDMDGIAVNNLVLNNATIRDLADNDAIITLNNIGNTNGVFVNTQHPSVSLTTTAPALVNAPFTVNITFSENVTGFAESDFTLTNATVSTLTGSNASYSVLVTPVADGPVSISLPADIAVNIGDNGNTASNTLNVSYDGTVPTVTSVSVPVSNYYNAGTIMDFTVRFSENITINTTVGSPTLTLNIGGIDVNATYTGVNGTDGLNFRYVVQDGDMDMDGIQVVSLNAAGSTIRDAATNNADLTLNNVGNTTLVRVNTEHPTVVLSTTSTAVNAPFTVTVTFSENVTGFTSSDFAVTNATLSPLTVIDNAHYTVTVVPIAEGAVTISVPANTAENVGHNGNTASNTLTITYDFTPPHVTSVSVPAPKYYHTGEVLTFTVHYNEDVFMNVTPGNEPYITLEIGANAVHAVYTGMTGTRDVHYSYTIVTGDEDMDGIIADILSLNGSTIKDAAGNDADPILYNAGNTSGVRVNTTSPGVTLSSTAGTLLNAPFTVTATFSEEVTGLTESDFSVTNGSVSDLQVTGATTYTLTVTPGSDGAVSILLPADAAVNIGNNGNAASNTLTFNYDGTKPQVSAVLVPIDGYYTTGDVLTFTVSFDENITVNPTGGTPYLNVILSSGSVIANYTGAGANSLSFSYTVQSGDMDLNGIQLGTALVLNGATIKDDATNDANLTLNNVGNMSQVYVHTSAPTVQLSTNAGSRVNAPFTVTVTFNEAVAGLGSGAFVITNGTAGSLSTADNITYTFEVTPATDGPVTAQLPAGQVQNIVSIGNTASNTLTVTYDATAPVIDGGLSFDVLERSALGTLVGKVTATDASGVLQDWTIVSDDSNGAFSIDADGNIRVADQAKLNAQVNNTVNLNITVTDGLNTSIAVLVTVEVKLVNQSPTLNAIDDVTVCPDGQQRTIQTGGASAVEPGQTYGFYIITDKPDDFDQLSISAAGLITYQLKTTATGTAVVTVTIKDDGGTANGGTDTLRRSFSINVATLGPVTITADKGNNVSKGDIVRLTATGGTIYRWDNADGILSGQNSDVLEVRPMQNSTYHVTASNAAGCTNTADFTVTVVADFKVDATNMLTPNGDGKNDKWVIRNLDSYPNNEVKIFDRAGRLVYTRRNYTNDWDGTMNGSPLAEGTYYYILTIEGGAKTAKGFITIIRDRH